MKIQQLALASAFLPPFNKNAPTSAWLGHIPFAGWLIEATRPRVFVELGTHYGDSYFAFCQAVKRNALPTCCYAVDTWQGDEHAGEYGEEVFAHVRRFHDAAFGTFSNLMRMRFDQALEHFSDGSVDLLHIDGLHTYEAVKDDFETWLPKLSERAIVLFHDTNVRQGDFGVWRYWEEISARYPHIRFDHSHGLGVLMVGTQQLAIVQDLLHAWNEESGAASIRDFFATLGEQHAAAWHDRKAMAARDETIAQTLAQVEQWQAAEREMRTYAESLQLRIKALDADVEHLRDETERLRVELASAERRTAELLNSTSWRITAPLRRIRGSGEG